MKAKIVDIEGKLLVGLKIKTNLMEDKAGDLWREFVSRTKEIQNIKGNGYYSLQFYNKNFPKNFNNKTNFDKWAALEVGEIDELPEGMQRVEIEKGKYAIFTYKGKSQGISTLMEYIYGPWLQESEFQIDNRAHFEYMGENYLGPNDPESEEEVWIPIK